jgi:phosphotransferase system  glucose/maltose/N-acetylglucosamine-specific IIC component
MDIGEGIVVFLVLLVVILFLIFIGIPFLIALGELVFVVLLAVAGIVGRVLFRRPWTVDAVSPTGEHHVWFVVGWKASGAGRRFVADRIARTNTVPTDQELSSALRSL